MMTTADDVRGWLGARTVAECSALDLVAGRVAEADLVVCRDSLAGVVERPAYLAAVVTAVRMSRLGAVLVGWEAAPATGTGAFHEPLSRTIGETRVAAAIPVGEAGDAIVYAALKDPSHPHPRDISAATLATAVPLVQDRRALVEVVGRSRGVLGFFPDHLPRAIEYPWILQRVRDAGASRAARVLDVGAGVNVLPVILHDDGAQVTTVDGHDVERTVDRRDAWNEWGFLDYSTLRAGIQSVRSAYERFESGEPFDVIYSVSVIEHLPAGLRRLWVERMARQVRPGGLVLLTVDIRPLSRALWNFSEGQPVEDAAAHGTLDDLLAECARQHLALDEIQMLDWLPASRVGVALIALRRTVSGGSPR